MMGKWNEYQYSVKKQQANTVAKLDANENWHVPIDEIRRVLSNSVREVDVREYPDGVVEDLKKEVGKHLGLPAETIIPSTGADQAIDLICEAFLRQGDRAIMVSPTFSMYRLRAEIAGATCVQVQMNSNFTLPASRMLERKERGGVLFICSPNNPTGNQFSAREVTTLIEDFRGLVVLDEAYVEFADFSLTEKVMKYENLAVLRTFSKAYGMAGLRLGYVVGHPSWSEEFLKRVQYPYPINSIAVAVATTLMKRYAQVSEWLDSVKRERYWLTGKLRALSGVKVIDSQANFLLVSLPLDSEAAHSALLNKGVATREVGRVLELPNCLRITVGNRRMNLLLLEALSEALRSDQ